MFYYGLALMLVLSILIFANQSTTEGFSSQYFLNDDENVEVYETVINDNEICDTNVYYPQYKGWWSYIMDLKTRPTYNRIFTPFWNTWYDPNITSDVYYQRVAADNIMPNSRYSNQINAAHKENFALRQQIKFSS